MKISHFEVEDLARVVLNLSDEVDEDDVEQAVYDRFDISMESFQKVVEALVPLTVPAITAIGNKTCQGFVKGGAFIVKVEVKA